MRKGFLILLAFLLPVPAAFAHRLNEYLQATTISLSRGEVLLELRLTPGVDVAPLILKNISQGQRLYVAGIVSYISLSVDGRQIPLQPVSYTFPGTQAIKAGTGDIIVEF